MIDDIVMQNKNILKEKMNTEEDIFILENYRLRYQDLKFNSVILIDYQQEMNLFENEYHFLFHQ